MRLPGSEAINIGLNGKEQVGDAETQTALAKKLSKDDRPWKSKEHNTELT